MKARSGYYLLAATLVSLLFFQSDCATLAGLAWNDDRYTHILVIPFVSLFLIYLRRERIFRQVEYAWRPAVVVGGVAAVLYSLAKAWPEYLGQNAALAAVAGALVLTWVAGFALFYGARSATAAGFPLALLLLAVPIPPAIVEIAEVALQKASAEVTYLILQLTSTPVYREGLVFALPKVTIEVAEQCSGIRSAISLAVTALVLGQLFLQTGWSRACCVLLTVPIAMVKNGVRISTLALLGSYVSEDYLHGDLHHRGGPLFSVLSLVLLLATLWLLRKGEDRMAQPPAAALEEAPQARSG
jgi:exosortase